MSSKNDIKIMPGAIVCEEAVLSGDITISSGCVIHPTATIIAESGPVIIGENCIIEEYGKIIHKRVTSNEDTNASAAPSKPPVLLIGPNNTFEVGCIVEALKIGEKNIFECKSYVSSDVKITNGCIIGAGCRLVGSQTLLENTVIYNGKKCFQREALEKQGSQTLQLEFLRKVLPNYYRLRKATFDPKKLREQI